MASLEGLDQNLPPREDGFNLLPAGQYVGRAIETEFARTKDFRGTILKLTWELIGRDYRGRRIWQTLTLTSTNAWAQRKAHEDMDALKAAIGITKRVEDPSHLHHRPVGLIVKIEPSKDPKYRDKNIVTGFFPADTSTPAYAVIKH